MQIRDLDDSKARLVSLLETVLFLESEPISLSALSKILDADEDSIQDALEILRLRYDDLISGLSLLETAGGWQIVPKSECWQTFAFRP